MATEGERIAEIVDVRMAVRDLPLLEMREALSAEPLLPALEALRAIGMGLVRQQLEQSGMPASTQLVTESVTLQQRLTRAVTGTQNDDALLAVRGLDGVRGSTEATASHAAHALEAIKGMEAAIGAATMFGEEAASHLRLAAGNLDVADGERGVFIRGATNYLHALYGGSE